MIANIHYSIIINAIKNVIASVFIFAIAFASLNIRANILPSYRI